MVASTGGPGTFTKPSVAAARVMLCAMVNAVTVMATRRPASNEDHQRQHKQQVIEAEKNVFDAKAQIGRRHFSRAWRGLNNERCLGRRQPFGLYCAGKAFDPNQYIRRCGRQALNRYRLPGEPSIPPNAAAFDIGPLAERRPRRPYILSAFGQFDVDREPQVLPPRGNLEKQIIGAGAGLAHLKIARPKFIRARGLRQQQPPEQQRTTEAIHRLVGLTPPLPEAPPPRFRSAPAARHKASVPPQGAARSPTPGERPAGYHRAVAGRPARVR